MNFKEQNIVVIGVSKDENKFGYKIFKSLIDEKYKVDGVNLKGDIVYGRTLYKNLDEINKKIDMVITVVPPKITENIVEICKKLNIKHIWMQPGSESEEAIKKAKDYQIKVTNACFMVMHNIW